MNQILRENTPITNPAALELNGEMRDIFKNMFGLFGMLDPNGMVIELYGSLFRKANTDPALLVGQRFSETVFWQSSENTPILLERSIHDAAMGKPVKVLLDFRISSDKKAAVELVLHPLKVNGSVDRIFISAQEVEERQGRVGHYKREIEELLFAAENADIGLWFWDLVEDKIYSTPKCNELFEIPSYDLLTYDSILNAVHPDDRGRLDGSLRKAHESGTKYSEEFRVLYSDGRIEWVSAEGKSFLDSSGQPEKMTAVVRKITEQKLAAEELEMVYDRERKARAEAVEANQSKDFFLAFVSHELRSPLNAILGWTKILMGKEVDPDTRRNALETIERSARDQNKLIDDIVDSTRVASGKIKLEFRPINLYEIIRVTVNSQRPQAEAHNLSFEFESDREEIMVFADAGRLQQVFSNLISNAIKFTPDGGSVSITIETGKDSARVRVTDSGQGISVDSLPYIFKQFSQGEVNSERGRHSLGLGLSIVKILVGKHGGTVSAESDGIGTGARFTVELPLSRVAKAQNTLAGGKATEPKPPLDGARVLLVEDDNDSREVVELFLQQSGGNVKSAASAMAAIEILDNMDPPPDVIVSDLAMPDEDGYSLLKRIRERPAKRGGLIPAVALSAFTTAESKQKAFDAGFNTYCTKPYDPERLIADILALIPRS